ncbi:Type-1 restriction enzyme EcoKI specificity protein [Candidatus Magnetaquicoccaceae bacterium FCR-1]|uniref:Type-1 restriction enzyme EcoKI specificity protein n=1 Tax=Candidatus Magnetaquiglobus chichijimensis TaxID=3141448 RepID=A0ABQ0CCA0_9PROT
MSFQRYAEYKDSGVEWLGEVPEHWEMCKTKFLFNLMKRQPRDEDKIVTAFRDGTVTLRENRRTEGFTYALQEIGYQGVRTGDLVIHAMDAFAGAIGVSDSNGKSTPVYSVCKPIDAVNAWYYGRLLRHMALSGYVSSLAKGIRERSTEFRWVEAGNVALPFPPLPEQSAIAAFLNRETGKIDALVAEQEKLIVLLKEKRQAVISHAVTKGLNPDAPMKDSGIEWLGMVPEHWEVKRFKDVCSEIVDCKNRTPEENEQGKYFVVRTSCIKDGRFDTSQGYFTDYDNFVEWTKKGVPQAGDILFTREAPAGEACISPADIPFCLGQRMMYLRPDNNKITSKYLMLSVYGPLARESIQSKSKGSTVGHLRVGEVGELPCIVPSVTEQKEIVTYIDNLNDRIDSLTLEAQRAIDLLKERRSALISAAVTGKIDVRELTAKEH